MGMWWAVLVSRTRGLDDVVRALLSVDFCISFSFSLSLSIYLYRDVVYTPTYTDAFASVDDAAACAIAVCVSHDSPAWNVGGIIDVDFSKMRSYGDCHWTDLSMIPHDLWCIPSDDRLEIVMVRGVFVYNRPDLLEIRKWIRELSSFERKFYWGSWSFSKYPRKRIAG